MQKNPQKIQIKQPKKLAVNLDVVEIKLPMELEIKCTKISDAESFESFRTLLDSSGLPYKDLDYSKHILLGYFENETLIGTGALEIYGRYALLRSLAVNDSNRGRSLGSKITDDLIKEARKNNILSIYLLTETARLFFKRKGFKDIDRQSVPNEVKESSEFSSVCPESAVCMEFSLPRI